MQECPGDSCFEHVGSRRNTEIEGFFRELKSLGSVIHCKVREQSVMNQSREESGSDGHERLRSDAIRLHRVGFQAPLPRLLYFLSSVVMPQPCHRICAAKRSVVASIISLVGGYDNLFCVINTAALTLEVFTMLYTTIIIMQASLMYSKRHDNLVMVVSNW